MLEKFLLNIYASYIFYVYKNIHKICGHLNVRCEWNHIKEKQKYFLKWKMKSDEVKRDEYPI